MTSSTIYIETYGCTANQNNSEIIAGTLKQAGYQITNNLDLAEIIILNTCIVKQKTITKIKRRIQDIAQTGKLMIISGCMPETHIKELEKLKKTGKLFFLGTHHFKDINKLLNTINSNQLTKKKQLEFLEPQNEEKLLLPKISRNKLISIIQISEGCLGNCTYCLTKFAKGKLFSYPEEKILKQIESDLNQGAKEIWITSQDNASYGLDKNTGSQLPALLNKILDLKHNFKIRLGMMNPNTFLPILDKMIEIYKDKKMYNFLHLPIQSASNNVLKSMNREYNLEQAEKILSRFKKEFPNITLATDIIIGYPTETEQEYKKNIEFITKFSPSVLNLAKFSRHKTTKASTLNPLPIKTIKQRTIQLMNLHRETAKQNKEHFLDKEVEVFVNNKKQGIYESRDENYNIILINTKEKILGKRLKVKIIEIGVHHMIGTLLLSKLLK